jgi:pimeloyl-ACP methyl ester carboxylesterase
MPRFETNGLTLHYEQYGARAAPPLVLIHGWSCQLTLWPKTLVEGLAERRLRVIALDNRDIGLSQKLTEDPAPTVASVLANPTKPPRYTLTDMANDVIGLMNHLGQAGAHVVGFSMGGMIAQRLAIGHPERVYSLTSIASTTGNPSLPRADAAAAEAFLRDPPLRPRTATIEFVRNGWNVIGGPHYKSTECGLGKLTEAAYDRAFSPDGNARQLAAIFADGNRAPALANVRAPTLVIHGAVDPLVPPAAGEDTAKAVPGAKLMMIPKMGHDLPEPLIPQLVDAIASHAAATALR